MSLSANGLSVQTQSALSILIGGVAFATPPASAEQPPADAETGFTLFSDRAQAFRPARGDPQTYELRLTQSVRGLTRGAPVEFRGFPVGEVTDMRSDIDEKTFEFYARIIVNVYPEMFGGNLPVADLRTEAGLAARHQRLDTLIARGLRAQLRSGSMLTGAMYVALDFFPDAAPVTIDWSENPVRIPVVPGEFEAIEASITRIIKKLDKVPVEAIGNDLAKALVDLRHTLGSAERTLDTAGQAIAPNSTLQTDLATTLQEVNRAARAASDLLDYLERHPEALIRGKTGEGKQ
jgi:paraquat-inducible protein B